MKQFKPAILFILTLTVLTIIWTTYEEISSTAKKGYASIANLDPIVRAATAPPIRASQAAPHPNWGACTNCHQMIGNKKTGNNGKPVSFMVPIATAPPIRAGAKAPHPSWGTCTNCHQMIGGRNQGGGTPGSPIKKAGTVAPPLGIWLGPITPARADKMGLDNTDGVIVTGVQTNSPAEAASVSIGDVITRIDNQKVENLYQALSVIGTKKVLDTVKLRIIRNGKERNIRIRIQGDAIGQQVGVPVALQTPLQGRVAVAATSTDLDARVAPSFGQTPVFVVYDSNTNRYYQIDNTTAGTFNTTQQSVDQLVAARIVAVIVGNIDTNAQSALQSTGVQVYSGVQGSVQIAIRQYLARNYQPALARGIPEQNPNTAANQIETVAIASQGRTLDAQVATDLEAAPYLIIYNTRTGRYSAVAKTPTTDPELTAVQTSHLVVDQGASGVIAGNISPTSVRTLGNLGVLCFAGVSGQVNQAIQLFRSGSLQATTVAPLQPNNTFAGAVGAQMRAF